MEHQKTLKQKITFSGIGVHSALAASVMVLPAEADAGIVFCNAKDASQCFKVGAVVPEVAMHATVVKNGSWFVSTIEHLMAALRMVGVDNAKVALTGHEIPILDGSALPFVQGFLDVGLEKQDVHKHFLTPRQILQLSDASGRAITIMPAAQGANELVIEYSADFNHPLAGSPCFSGTITVPFFVEQVAPARTFGFLEQLPFLRQHNLAQGSSLSNTIVIGQEVLNDMRFADECVRHKVLDLLGDVALLPYQLAGMVKAHKTGHSFNRMVVEHYYQNPDKWLVL